MQSCKNKTKLICHDGDSTSKTSLRIEDIHSAPALLSWSLTLAHSKNLHRAITHISCRHQHVSQRGDVVVSVEPRHEQDAEPHVHQERHQDVAFPADRHQSGDAALQSATVSVQTRWSFTRRPPHELLMLDGWFGRAQRPHVFGPVADLDTCGQFTGQEAQRVKTEDPAWNRRGSLELYSRGRDFLTINVGLINKSKTKKEAGKVRRFFNSKNRFYPALHCSKSVEVNRELSLKAKLSIQAELRSDHETNRVSLRIQAAEMSVMMLHLHIKRSQLGLCSIWLDASWLPQSWGILGISKWARSCSRARSCSIAYPSLLAWKDLKAPHRSVGGGGEGGLCIDLLYSFSISLY